MLNDPSGNIPIDCYDGKYCGAPKLPQPLGGSDGGNGGGGPLQPLSGDDPVELTTVGERGSGLQAQETYNRLASMCENYDPAAWWCSSPGTFTQRDFMMLVMSSELSPLGGTIVDPITRTTVADDPVIQAKLAEAAANWFSVSCLYHPNCIGTTPNAIFNWLGENFESAQRLFPATAMPTNHPNMNNLATVVVNSVLSVGSSPKEPGTWDLVHWANKSWFEDTFGVGHYPTANYMILGGENPAYVIPYSEERRLACGSPYC